MQSDTPPVRKVVAYISRERDGKTQLLVFTHRDYPEAGLQVPAGTVQPNEDVESALRREIAEETGIEGFTVVHKLGVFLYDNPNSGQMNERHVFHVLAPNATQDAWDWLEAHAEDSPEGYVFCLHWQDLDSPIDLAGNQGDYLHLLHNDGL